MGVSAPEQAVKPRRPRVSEKVVEAAVIRAYAAFGCRVWKHSEPRAAMISAGYPDLTVVATCPWGDLLFYHEVKAQGGKLRPDQLAFRKAAEAAGLVVVVGGLAEARTRLEDIGLALKDGTVSRPKGTS